MASWSCTSSQNPDRSFGELSQRRDDPACVLSKNLYHCVINGNTNTKYQRDVTSIADMLFSKQYKDIA